MLSPLQLVLIGSLMFCSLRGVSAQVTKSDVVADSTGDDFVETHLSPADFTGARELQEIDLTTIGIAVPDDPTLSGRSEGDIALPNIKSFVDDSNKLGRNAIRQFYRRWPNGIIPYTVSSAYGSYARRVIAKAMDEYHQKTCIKFVPRDSSLHRDYIYIHPDDGCYSLVGRTGGRQPLSLDAGCIQTGTIVHELMHTVGFFHEQSRADRDEFIEIAMENVMKDADDQFEKYSMRVIDHLDEPYDYNSIMHYGPYAFSKNGRETIVPKPEWARRPGATRMGQRSGFSDIDLRKIKKLYYCENLDTVQATSGVPTETSPVDTNGGNEGAVGVRGACIDENWRCSFWSMGVFGYCEKYEEIRNKVCAKSCGTCNQAPRTTDGSILGTIPLTQSTQPTQSGLVCKDFNPACVRWSIKGHCTRSGYESFMTEQCPISCGTCPQGSRKDVVNECMDDPSYKVRCEVVKLFDRCNSPNSREMVRNYCRKSCNLCNA